MPDEFQWDPIKRRYIRPNGKVVTAAEMRRIGLSIVEASTAEIEDIATTFVAGRSTFAEWAVAMRDAVKATHSAMAQLAHGGKAQMGPKERGLLGSTIRRQYGYLANFALGVEHGQVEANDALVARASMYGEAGWATYTEATGQREKFAGAQQERSFLEPDAEHCQECFDEAGKDWQPIGTLTPIGQRTCLSRCQCEFEYRQAPAAEAE